jgi:hypothetical protein
MASDCFGNPTPFPPGIADTFHDIQRYRHIPFSVRYAYLNLRNDAMVGRATADAAWTAYYELGDYAAGSRSDR